MLARSPGLHNLVKRVEGEPAAGKMAVNGTRSKWKRLARASTAFETNQCARVTRTRRGRARHAACLASRFGFVDASYSVLILTAWSGIPPELREGEGEVALARTRRLPGTHKAERPSWSPALPHGLLGRRQHAWRDGRGDAQTGLSLFRSGRPFAQCRIRRRPQVRSTSSDESILPRFACARLDAPKAKTATAICLTDQPAQALADMVFGPPNLGPLAGMIRGDSAK